MRKELLIAALGISISGTLHAATRQEVDKLLDKLSKRPIPKNLSLGASCYVTAVTPERQEYVCPVCGTKTFYSREEEHSRQSHYVIYNLLRKYRKDCEELRNLNWDVTLDETFLCSKCSKPDQPQEFILSVTIDGKTARTKMESNDLQKLIAFAKKRLTWKNDQDDEFPLKKELPRIRKLLGIPAE